jgi:hypothetical protein
MENIILTRPGLQTSKSLFWSKTMGRLEMIDSSSNLIPKPLTVIATWDKENGSKEAENKFDEMIKGGYETFSVGNIKLSGEGESNKITKFDPDLDLIILIFPEPIPALLLQSETFYQWDILKSKKDFKTEVPIASISKVKNA